MHFNDADFIAGLFIMRKLYKFNKL